MASQLSGFFDQHVPYFYMIINLYLVRTKAHLWVIIFYIEIIQGAAGLIILILLTISLVVQIYIAPPRRNTHGIFNTSVLFVNDSNIQ